MSGRLKVLAVAAAAHPERGSEPGLGWRWVESLAEHHDLWVVTGEREGNREAVERRMRQVTGLSERLRVCFVPRPDGPAVERVAPLLYYRRYRRWHQEAFRRAGELAKEVEFDIVHQVNMTGYREPGYLWMLDRPFVWGPVGGTANVPLRFASVLGARGFLYHLAKVAVNGVQLRALPRVRRALERADGFVTSTSDTRAAFLRVWGKESTVIADTGPPLDYAAPCPSSASASAAGKGGGGGGGGEGALEGKRKKVGEPLRLVWSGLHLSRKALPLALRALALLPPSCPWHLDILGDGPMSGAWRALSGRLGLEGRCTWHGWVERPRVREIMDAADLLVFPSLHEGMPTVVMEALSLGLPVICLDHCGQGDAVDDTCGVKVAVTTPAQVIREIAAAVKRLAGSPGELARLSRGARARVRAFDWDAKALAMCEVYARAVADWERGRRR